MTKTGAITSKAKAAILATLKAPTAEHMSFSQLRTNFEMQTYTDPVESQRNHQKQNASGRAHIKTEVPASSQAVIHVVKVVGKLKLRSKYVLIDGYHRLHFWFEQDRCPFDRILVIIHEIQADTEAEFKVKVDVLASTIDNRAAVKSNADRWCAALRDAGLEAESQAYSLGLRSRTFLNRTLGSAKVPMSQLTEKAKAGMAAHVYLDQVYHFAEKETTIKCQAEYLHAGIAQAMYMQFMKKGVNAPVLLDKLTEVYQKLGGNKHAAGRVTLNKQQAAVYEQLMDLATDLRQKELRSRGNRETYYTEVAKELTPVLDALRKVCSRRVKAVI